MGRATVLVVDDERKIREVVCSYLEREGYAVLQAGTGQRALEAMQRGAGIVTVLTPSPTPRNVPENLLERM